MAVMIVPTAIFIYYYGVMIPMPQSTSEVRAKIAKFRAVGYSNKEIAEKLGIPASNVSYHVQKMKQEAKKKGADEAFEAFLLGAAVGAGAVGLTLMIAKMLEKK